MNAIVKTLLAVLVFGFAYTLAYAQTAPTETTTTTLVTTTEASGNAAASEVNPEFAKKIAQAKTYLTKDVFEYVFSGVWYGRTFSLDRKMYPTKNYSAFYQANDQCVKGDLKTYFTVDEHNGDLVADVQGRASYCPRLVYRFDVLTKVGVRTMYDGNTKQVIPDDPSFRFTLK